MTRWIGKRGLWGVVAGAAVAGGAFATEPGDVVTFKEGTKDRKVTVTKVNKKADGSLEVTGKDAASGEVTTWVEGPSTDAPAAGGKTAAPMTGGKAATPTTPVGKTAAPPAAPPALPKAKARPDDPIAATPPMPETSAERDRRLFNGKLLGRDATPTPPAAAAGTPVPQVAEAGEPKAKTGLLNRIFGKKAAPVPAAMPGPAVTTPAPATKAGPAAPLAGEPKVAAPARPVVTPPPAPAVKTTAPVAVPTPAIPVPMPAARPPVSAPPVAAPAVGAPPVAIPVPQPLPPVVPLPTIPGVPQSARPGESLHVVLPVGYVPPEVAMNDDLRPFATTLRDAGASVSDRVTAARGLALGRHGSTDRVKGMLFAAAQADPAAAVRVARIEQLVRLGYYHPDFVRHLQTLAEGAAGEERDAARAGLTKMTPRRW